MFEEMPENGGKAKLSNAEWASTIQQEMAKYMQG